MLRQPLARKKMNFTAIDFETANGRRGSACAVGLAIVEKGVIVERLHQLIKPDPLYFDPCNVSIHGITAADVGDAPTFLEFWPTLRSRVSAPLVAHYAAFDMSVLCSALDQSGLAYPKIDYFCTCVIAKLAWPQYPTYKLDQLARAIGISFNHHNAEEDAYACARIAITACKQLRVTSLYDLQHICGLEVGHLHASGYSSCGRSASARVSRRRPARPRRAANNFF